MNQLILILALLDMMLILRLIFSRLYLLFHPEYLYIHMSICQRVALNGWLKVMTVRTGLY